MSEPHLLKVRIRDTETVVYEGNADRVESYNEVGKFDILPLHANFISMIRQQLNIYLKHQKIKELKMEQAILKVKNDEVHVFLGLEIFALNEAIIETGKKPK